MVNMPELRSAVTIATYKHQTRTSATTPPEMKSILSAKKTSRKLKTASSVQSEDSTSSKEERRKKNEPEDQELDLSESEAKCLTYLKSIPGVSPEVIRDLDTIFKKYQEGISKERKARLQAEAELVNKLEKMNKFLQTTTSLQEEANQLKKQLDKKAQENLALKIELDESHKREQDLYDEKKGFMQKIEQLDRDLDKRQLEDKIKEGDVKGKTRENYIKEIGRLKRELEVMGGRLFASHSECKTLERKLWEKEKDYTEMEEMVKTHQYDVMKHEQKRKIVETDLERTLATMNYLKGTLNKHYETFKKAVQELMKKDEENFELKKTLKVLDGQQTVMSKYIIELRDRLEYLSKVYFEVEDQNLKLKALCSNQTGSLEVIKKRSIDIETFQDKWLRRLDLVNRKRKDATIEAKKLKSKLVSTMRRIKHHELVELKLHKRIKELQRENVLALEDTKKVSDLLHKEKAKSSENKKIIMQLQEEIENLKSTVTRQQKEIEELYKYANIVHKDMKALESRKELATSDLRATLLQLINSERLIKTKERELKDINFNYDNLFIEKKTLEGRLIESKVLAKDYGFKVSHFCDEITKYKQQIDLNDNLIARLQRRLKRVEHDYTSLNKYFNQGKLENRTLRDAIMKKEKEKDLLNRLIGQGEKRKTELTKEIEKLQRNVSILKSTMQQKTAEIKLVYEKTELMTFFMKSGENEIKQKLADIKLLKLDIGKLRTENKTLKTIVENNGNLQKEIISLQKDLAQANQKCRALEEQMENPINVHRWRLLKRNDPEKNELIEKNQLLLKKLLLAENKNNELKEQYRSIDIAYSNFKKQIENMPGGSECVMKLQEAKRNLREKTHELQRLTVELSSYQREVRVVRKEMEDRKIKADECMKKYYELKKILEEEKGMKFSHKIIEKENLLRSPGRKILFTDSPQK